MFGKIPYMTPHQLAKTFLALTSEEQAEFFIQLTHQFRVFDPRRQELALSTLAKLIYNLDQDDDSFLNNLITSIFDQHNIEEKVWAAKAASPGMN